MTKKILRGLFLVLVLAFSATPSRATIATDLQGLVAQGTNLRDQLSNISVDQGGACSRLGELNISMETYLITITGVINRLTVPITLTSADTTALDTLSTLAKEMAIDAVRLSWELRDIENVAELFEYRAALSAMLRLSDDIGKMADRILEMGDRILIMADNIGAMADRILITQQLQNSNVALTQSSILVTQTNMVTMSDSLSSIAYNMTLGMVQTDAVMLESDIGVTTLTSNNMAIELDRLAAKTALLLSGMENLYAIMSQNSQTASHFVDGDTLTLLGDISTINKALALSLETYANVINQMAPLTQTPILADATAAMLRLTTDIGKMSGRIIEMTDKIIVMADNIGLMSDRIITTQSLQQANMELTRNSLLTAQNVTVTVVKNFL
jgi:hypothetical protein